ncbi:hypothetical protein OROMI_018474 [Orobanche minor]
MTGYDFHTYYLWVKELRKGWSLYNQGENHQRRCR